jgi:hypothetical protein
MNTGINFLYNAQFSYNKWHSQKRMLDTDRQQEYVNKESAQ